ncbi:MAG: hypothetical protein CMI79_06625 [Candidatus Pelagibacter sp.]|nr:hypothetical protein [Candidatus Pelagibacter sp.]|tara:strand:+ start:3385 stop:3846 length:462 start_codon:yes stop_codon:yes gene_type:complete
MSGASSLSAAKRRRGTSASNTTSQVSNNNQVIAPGKIPGRMPPLNQLLYVHEERIRRLERLVPDEGLDNISEDVLSRKEFVNVVQMINDELGKMKQLVSNLESSVISNSDTINSATEDVKEQVKEEVISNLTDEVNNITISVNETSTKVSESN